MCSSVTGETQSSNTLQPDTKQCWDPGGQVTGWERLHVMLAASVHGGGQSGEVESRTELDSHANMAVVGKYAYVLSEYGKTVDVSPFSPHYPPTTAPLVDAALQYECPYDGNVYVLIIRNALHIPSMDNNLIPPFMMREAGLLVKDTPKIQVRDPDVNDHAITFPETGFRIPLALWGVFSYFPTSKPSKETLNSIKDVYLLTPDRWNPHADMYAINEESMLDWEGNITDVKDRETRLVLDEIPDNEAMVASLKTSMKENNSIDDRCGQLSSPAGPMTDRPIPCDDEWLWEAMEHRAELGRYQASIGATIADNGPYVETVDAGGNDDDQQVLELDQLSDDELEEIMASAMNATRTRGIEPQTLAKVWRISVDDAKRTLDITTQGAVRVHDPTLVRNFTTNDRMLRYKRIHEYFFMDTFFATKRGGKSSRGHTCCQLFVSDKGFVYVVPMRQKSDVLQAVKQFAKEIGAPDAIISDSAREQKSLAVRKLCINMGTELRVLEEGTPWANRAELYIGLLKESVRKDMLESNSPLPFWDYCCERRARIHNLTAKDAFRLHGTNPHTATLNEEGDLSNICQYQWYEWCYYREQNAAFPFNKEVLGRVLGPARGEGNEMAQWILKANGNVVPRRSHRPLQTSELHSPSEEKKRRIFDALIERRWGTSISPPQTQPSKDFDLYEDETERPNPMPDTEDTVDADGRLLDQQPAYDTMINAEVLLQQGEEYVTCKIIGRSTGPDGKTHGKYDENPYLNSIMYDVEMPDGQVKEYCANVIAQNMLAQVDPDGYSMALMEGIVDHRRDHTKAVSLEDAYVTTKSGRKRLRKTTTGWDLLVRWKDQSESWIRLADMKEAHPVETAEYAKSRGIEREVAFAWWVPYTLRKRDVILASIKRRIRKTTHKYGIEIPSSVEHAHEIDKQSGNNLWRDAIQKEMFNVGIAFEVLNEGQKAPVGWHKVTGHLVYDVKMDFTRKARWVLDGHKTADPIGSSYAGVVSRESIRIAFTYAALNHLDVCAADIRNAYLQAPSSRKDYIICGAEFGLEHVGKVALIHRALYGGKTAGKDFRNHLRSCMHHLHFVSCPADPDVWMRPALKSDGSSCYEYILLYTDDALAISENAEGILRREIGKYFELKEDSIGSPKLYLGGKVRRVQLDNGVFAWSFSSSQYVQAAVKNVEEYLAKPENCKWKIPSKAETPTQTTYRPELDVSPELSPEESAYYQSLIGVLRWIVELGRVDICLEVSMMSSHLVLPREGHLAQVFHIFAYLKKYHNTEMVFDPSDPVIDQDQFEPRDWSSSEFGHVEGKEELPPKMPEPRGRGFIMRAKVDADHASDTVTRRSRTGFLAYLNSAPIYWWSKKQNSVESSSFGSEFTAMKQCCEYLRGLRYKLRMMGIPCEGPAYIYGDNQSVLANTTIPDSTLKKKSQSIAYHFVREGSARDEWRTTYVSTHDNEADLLTKQLPSGEKRKNFVRNILHHIFRTDA